MKKLKFYISIIGLLALASCAKEADTADPEKSFTKIINQNNFSNAVSAIATIETSNGFLILATNQIPNEQYPNITLIAIDKKGKVMAENNLDPQFVCPTKEIFAGGSGYRFFCMNALTTNTYAVEVNAEGKLVSSTEIDVAYPLAVGQDTDGGFLIQGYSQEDRTTILAKCNAAFVKSWEKGFFIFESVDEPVFGHLNKSGKQYQFSVGRTNNRYFFNGFRNYTFSLVFVDPVSVQQTGVANGFRYTAGISGIQYLDGNNFAVARFDFGKNYFNPRISIDQNVVSDIDSLQGRNMLEVEPDAVVLVKKMILNGKPVLVYATNTVNKQIALFVYDQQSGSLINTKYYGFNIPCEFGNIISTSDGGVLLIGSAFVEGRFKRVCLFKLAQSQVESLVK